MAASTRVFYSRGVTVTSVIAPGAYVSLEWRPHRSKWAVIWDTQKGGRGVYDVGTTDEAVASAKCIGRRLGFNVDLTTDVLDLARSGKHPGHLARMASLRKHGPF